MASAGISTACQGFIFGVAIIEGHFQLKISNPILSFPLFYPILQFYPILILFSSILFYYSTPFRSILSHFPVIS